MKTKISLLALLIALSTVLMAGNETTGKETSKTKVSSPGLTLAGVVTDHLTGEALAGVKLTLEGSEQVVYTDLEGKFSFSALTDTRYDLASELISYKSGTIEVNPTDNNAPIEIKLETK